MQKIRAIKILKIILIVCFLLIIVTLGFYLRAIKPNQYAGKVYNVNAYYFYKAKYLNDLGRLPEKDIWSVAPESLPENVPPLLPLAGVGAYKIAKIFKPGLDFYDSVMFFPVLIYVFWAISGFWLIYYLFKNYFLSFVFLILLTVMPIVLNFTAYGYFTEEGIGAFLFFICLIFLIKFIEDKKQIFFWLTIFCLTAFYLAWQQFPIFLVGLFIAGLVQILVNRKNWQQLIVCFSLIIILPLIFGHLISRYLIMIDYSPIYMINETIFGAININSEFIQVAMFRQDWRDIDAEETVSLFGMAAWVLGGAGLLKSLLNFKKPRYQVALIFVALTAAVAIKFYKSRYLALAPLLLISGIGTEFFMTKSKKDWEKIINFFGRLNGFFVRALRKRTKMICGIGIFLILLFGLSYLMFFNKANFDSVPQPEIQLNGPSSGLEIGKEYQIEMKLENRGAASLQEPVSFGGFHIEIQNAQVKDIVSWADNGPSEVMIKPEAQMGDIYWFEAKYYGLFKPQDFSYVWFKIIPQKLPVNFYYRGWLPSKPTFLERLKTMISLTSEYRNWQNSWRSEKAIKRAPANNDLTQGFCQIKVFAAYEEPQDFRCFKQSVK